MFIHTFIRQLITLHYFADYEIIGPQKHNLKYIHLYYSHIFIFAKWVQEWGKNRLIM
jgi:hypothetical protein